jgi:hypothetical protein
LLSDDLPDAWTGFAAKVLGASVRQGDRSLSYPEMVRIVDVRG